MSLKLLQYYSIQSTPLLTLINKAIDHLQCKWPESDTICHFNARNGLFMEDYCREVIDEIKTAKSESELIQVISSSMSQLRREKRSYNEAGYIMNMLASLRANDTHQHPSMATRNNIQLAIAIFRQLQKEKPERVC